VSDPVDGAWSRPPAFESGAAGLVSTAGDMIAFGRLLLSGGGPVLSRRSVEAMTSDQLTPAQREVVDWVPFDGTSWGLGVGLATARTGPAAAPGRFGWDGGLGSSWSCDRPEDLVGVLLTQTMWTSATGPAIAADFWTAAYSALT
jgi:CubicO group peptidase (beta-lactamase class C family)